MPFTVNTIQQLPQQSTCIIAGIFSDNTLSTVAQQLDQASAGAIKTFLAKGDFTGKVGQTALLYQVNGADRVLLVGCGDKKGINEQDFYKLLRSIAGQLKQLKATHAVFAVTELNVNTHDVSWQARQAIILLRDELYNFTQLKSKKEDTPSALSQIDFLFLNGATPSIQSALQAGNIIADSVALTKDLAYLPANICTPTYLAEQAKQAAAEIPALKVEILEEAQMRELKMGALLAVTQGSQQPAKLVIIHYQGGATDAKPVVLVGKGITFDTGGISLKPAANIAGMKFDMCGAASVLGTLRAAALLKLPVNVIGIMVCVENMIGSHAYRPDDVITSMSGQTIEVNNTDAEGRLILCDALTYCARFQPDVVIDMATLTGAIIVALGKHATGLFSNNQELADALLAAGQKSGDRLWQLPIWEDYQCQLDSVVADMVNSGTSGGNSITAACFLSRFTKDYRWAHLDIAGTAFSTGPKASATGRPVPMLVQYLLDKK